MIYKNLIVSGVRPNAANKATVVLSSDFILLKGGSAGPKPIELELSLKDDGNWDWVKIIGKGALAGRVEVETVRLSSELTRTHRLERGRVEIPMVASQSEVFHRIILRDEETVPLASQVWHAMSDAFGASEPPEEDEMERQLRLQSPRLVVWGDGKDTVHIDWCAHEDAEQQLPPYHG